MQGSLRISIVTIAATLFFHNYASGTEQITPVRLRYVISTPLTNVYSIQIEVQGESGREAIGGNFVLSLRAETNNLINLSATGQLQPRSVGRTPGMGFRPGYPGSLASYAMYPQFEGKSLICDEHGEVVRQAGDVALPIPLGQLLTSLVQKYPADATTGWEDEASVSVLDEPLLQGPAAVFLNSDRMGFYPGRGVQGVLACRQKITMKVTAATPEPVTLRKTLSLDSQMLYGAEPRVSATEEGTIVLDRATGWPKQIDLECKTVAATENLSRRSIIALHWKLLEGAEREAVIAPQRAAAESKFTPDEVAKLMAQLQSDDAPARQSAARDLSGSRLESPTPQLLSLFVRLVNDPDDAVRRAAITFISTYGTKEQVPLLIKSLNQPDASLRTAAAKGLGRLKDPRAAEPLAQLLASGQTDQSYYRPRENNITEALARLGPAAEPAMLALLKEKNVETRCQACVVLKQVGTKKSLGVLKEMTLYPNKELSEAAADACRSIQARDGD